MIIFIQEMDDSMGRRKSRGVWVLDVHQDGEPGSRWRTRFCISDATHLRRGDCQDHHISRMYHMKKSIAMAF